MISSGQADAETVRHAAEFLVSHLPYPDDEIGWEDCGTSAWVMACRALVEFGWADATDWGAKPRVNPELPAILPRLDDICYVVWGLANQQDVLHPTGPLVETAGSDGPNSPDWAHHYKKIKPAHGVAHAFASSQTLSILKMLGLIKSNCWTELAEFVLWRQWYSVWRPHFNTDQRFLRAVDRAIDTMPTETRATMDRLVAISDADVAASVAKSDARYEELRRKYGPKARLSSPHSSEEAKQSLEAVCGDKLNRLFEKDWRFGDGWLKPNQLESTLPIYHDTLASAVRRTIAERLYPHASYASQ